MFDGTKIMTDTPGNIPPSGPLPGRLRLYVLLIAGLTLAVYSPLLRSGFTNWDDQEMVVNNAAIRSLGIPGIVHIFGMTSIGHYHPLVLISYALDHALGGFDPHVFHASSLLLHLANILLVALFAWRLTANAVITGVTVTLFALHPLQVEPVAWISSRKDLLFSFWYLGGLLAYLRYRERPRRAWYFAALALALLSCLSKSMAVTFPVVLVLLDRYAGRSLRGPVLYEKVPFFVISLLFGVLSIVTQSGAHAVRLGDSFSAVNQFFVGCHGIMFYLTRLFIPSGFSAFYPYPARSAGALPLEYLLSPLAVVALCSLLFASADMMRASGSVPEWPWLWYFLFSSFCRWRTPSLRIATRISPWSVWD